MGDKNFGYTPPNLPYEVSQYYDYAGTEPIVDYTPTPWDNADEVNIDTMWAWIQRDSDERTTAVADMWRRISTLLDATHSHLQRHGEALTAKWTGDAAKSFMQHLGAAMYSLDEWKSAADSNARGLDRLAGDIATAQREMRVIWQNYTKDFGDAKAAHEAADKESGLAKFGDWLTGTDHGPTPNDVRQKYTDQAKPKMQALAKGYLEVFEQNLGRGTKYQGPTNATVATAPNLPGGSGPPPPPGGPPGAPPGGLGAPPPAPPGGTQGPPPPAPPPGNGANLAGGVVAPPPPAPTGLPSVPGPGGPLGAPPAPPPAFPPGLAGGGFGPGGRGPAPARPTGLPGEGEPGGRGAPPSRPNLSGRGRPPARPAVGEPGEGRGAPSRPNLRGNTGRGRAPGRPSVGEPESEGRSGRPGAPGSRGNPLRGSRGGAPGEPEGRGPGGRGGPGGRPRPGRPNLERGARPGSVPEDFESSRGQGSPPRLTGRRGGLSAGAEEGQPRSFGSRPGAEAKRLGGRRGPDRPGELPNEEQEAFSRRTPQRPDLTRRLSMRRGPVAEPSSELGGRRNPAPAGRQQPSEPPRHARRRRGKDEQLQVEHDRMWTVDSPGEGVIDTPAEPGPSDPGPVLGRGH